MSIGHKGNSIGHKGNSIGHKGSSIGHKGNYTLQVYVVSHSAMRFKTSLLSLVLCMIKKKREGIINNNSSNFSSFDLITRSRGGLKPLLFSMYCSYTYYKYIILS